MSEDKMPGIGDLMNVAQKLQGDVSRMQEELASMQFEASSGGGMVTAIVNGQHELVAIKIDPEAVTPSDVDLLQDLIVAAVNQATQKMRESTKQEMAKLTGGLNIPGLSNLL